MSAERKSSIIPGGDLRIGEIQENGEILVGNVGGEKAKLNISFPKDFASEQNLGLEVSVIGPNHVICKVIQDSQNGKSQHLACGPICLEHWKDFYPFCNLVGCPQLPDLGGYVQVVRLETEEQVKQYLSVARVYGYDQDVGENELFPVAGSKLIKDWG